MSSLDQIATAVLDWQRRHPLALRLGPDAVHSIGLVALPFLRAAEGSEPAAPPWWQRWRRAAGPDRAAFSETFIEGIAPAAAARFASQQGVETVDGMDDWPQRRVDVDSALAEVVSGGWPYERWLATAALDGPHGRQRVLISLRENGPPAVLGHRHWDRKRLVAAALLPTLALAAWLLLRPSPPPPVNPPSAAGSVANAASAASASISAASAPAAAVSPASSASAPAGPEAASAAAESASATASEVSISAAPDIRPRLGPQRAEKRPAIGAPAAPAQAAASSPPASASAPQPQADAPSLRALPPGAPPVALISPGFASRADADAMLARMLEHTSKTLAQGARLDGEVFSSPQGFRAAVWPFASREEAQLINATMVARGWKTRAVDF